MSCSDQRLPKALVLRWNGRTLRARCPYCLDSHGHGFLGPLAEENIDQAQLGRKLRVLRKRRRSDCADVQIGGEYLLAFPQTSDTPASDYGWEVDGETCGFITVNHEGTVPVPISDYWDGRTLLPHYTERHQIASTFEEADDDTDDLVADTGALKLENRAEEQPPKLTQLKTDDEIWEELYVDPDFRRDMYFRHCIYKEVQQLESLYRQYPDDGFIGCVDEEGNTGVLLAATEENGLRTLRWLYARGDPIDRANHYGRTPLMEAALWGRLKTVQYLTHQNICLGARDGNGMQAADLAADTQHNTKERVQRSGKVYREPPDAGRQREQIQALLERLTSSGPERANTAIAPPRRAFFGRKSDGKLEIYRPQVLLEPPTGPYGRQKAFSTLDRGSNYPYVNAMSGYSHTGWTNVLDNGMWTDKADDLRALLGLPKDKLAASHVEPQLLAYLLQRHSLQDRQELASAMPTYILQPIITVSKPDLCDQCLDLFQRFKDRFPGFGVVFHCVGDSIAAPRVRD